MIQLKEAVEKIREKKEKYLYSAQFYLTNSFPITVKAIQAIDTENMRPKRRQGFNLVGRESKKNGVIYYARFSYNGKMLPTKFNTHTSDINEAEKWAVKNKEKMIAMYLARKNGQIYTFLENFYFDKQICLELNLSEQDSKDKGDVLRNKFIPFLKNKKIASFEQIQLPTLIKFQNELLSGELKKKKMIRPQTVNGYMKAVRTLFKYLLRKSMISENPAENLRGLPVSRRNRKARGCYDLDKIKDVFCKRWKEELSYLLCAVIYTTGMRNGEIKRLKIEDVQIINGCKFINVKQSKTEDGIRLVPIHDILYKKLKIYAIKSKKAVLFDDVENKDFAKANNDLAKHLNVSTEVLENDNITFYSGRHYWKTLMSAEGLGEDIEEIFMGHKVVGDVKKLYNHRDRLGKERLVKKASQVISIIDRCIFNKNIRASAKVKKNVDGGN